MRSFIFYCQPNEGPLSKPLGKPTFFFLRNKDVTTKTSCENLLQFSLAKEKQEPAVGKHTDYATDFCSEIFY